MVWFAAEGQSGNKIRHFASVCNMTWMTYNISNSIWNSVVDSSGHWEHIFLTLDQSPSPSLSTDIRHFLSQSPSSHHSTFKKQHVIFKEVEAQRWHY